MEEIDNACDPKHPKIRGCLTGLIRSVSGLGWPSGRSFAGKGSVLRASFTPGFGRPGEDFGFPHNLGISSRASPVCAGDFGARPSHSPKASLRSLACHQWKTRVCEKAGLKKKLFGGQAGGFAQDNFSTFSHFLYGSFCFSEGFTAGLL